MKDWEQAKEILMDEVTSGGLLRGAPPSGERRGPVRGPHRWSFLLYCVMASALLGALVVMVPGCAFDEGSNGSILGDAINYDLHSRGQTLTKSEYGQGFLSGSGGGCITNGNSASNCSQCCNPAHCVVIGPGNVVCSP
jgi:hypothetical protein